MFVKVRWWDASLAFWILAKVTTRFIKSLHFLNIIFAKLPGGKSTGPSEFNFFCISLLKSLNLALIPGAKLDAHRGTWTGCFYLQILSSKIWFFIWSDLYIQRVGLKYKIWLETTKEGSLWELSLKSHVSQQTEAQWDIRVIKRVGCIKSQILYETLQKNCRFRLHSWYGNQ